MKRRTNSTISGDPRSRRLRLETLESRELLDATSPRFAASEYVVQEGGAAYVEALTDAPVVAYWWDITNSPTVDVANFYYGPQGLWLEPDSIDLTPGESGVVRMIVQDEHDAYTLISTNLVSQQVPPGISANMSGSLDGQFLRLELQTFSPSCVPTSQWTIDWGDGQKTTVDALGDSLVVAHRYIPQKTNVTYYLTLSVVDANGYGQENVFELGTRFVEAGEEDPIKRFTTDEFYDVEKNSYRVSELCWASGAANVLYYTGWADSTPRSDLNGAKRSFTSEDDVFAYFTEKFTNEGGSSLYGFEWFLTGVNPQDGKSGWADSADGSGGFYVGKVDPDDVSRYYTYKSKSYEPETLMPTVTTLLQDDWGVCVSVAFYQTTPDSSLRGGHTITLWGFEYDSRLDVDDPDRYTAIVVSDSDNDAYQGRSAPNTLQTYAIHWDETYRMYRVDAYEKKGVCWLQEFIVLAPRSNALRSPALDEAFASTDWFQDDLDLSWTDALG